MDVGDKMFIKTKLPNPYGEQENQLSSGTFYFYFGNYNTP
jgi:hypothetical protein